jgi:hypothetical protein
MSQGPDFLRPVAKPGALAWAWCATGLLVLAVALADAATAWAGREQAVQKVQAAPALQATPKAQTTTASQTTQTPKLRAATDARAAQRWLLQLAHPWPQAWAASESASEPGIAWLTLEHSLQGALRLEGLATDEAPAQQAARRLRDLADPVGPRWQGVALVRTERVPGGQRFEITAQLRADPEPAPAAAFGALADATLREPGPEPGLAQRAVR